MRRLAAALLLMSAGALTSGPLVDWNDGRLGTAPLCVIDRDGVYSRGEPYRLLTCQDYWRAVRDATAAGELRLLCWALDPCSRSPRP